MLKVKLVTQRSILLITCKALRNTMKSSNLLTVLQLIKMLLVLAVVFNLTIKIAKSSQETMQQDRNHLNLWSKR